MQSSPTFPAWIRAPAVWAGLSIITMWLAVLFVGLFGGNIVSSSASGSTSIPVVVVLLPFVLPATIVAARRGFRGFIEDEHSQTAPEPTAERPEMRPKAA